MFPIHKIVRATADDDSTDEGGEISQHRLDNLARCLENICKDGYKYVVPKMRIPVDAKTKHVLLLGKTGNGKSTMGNVLTGRYEDGFRVSQGGNSINFFGQ